MQNHKGAVATLLTLGLVIVGTLITLGTSFFVSNNKNNLASNSMAAQIDCGKMNQCQVDDKTCKPISSNINGETCCGAFKNLDEGKGNYSFPTWGKKCSDGSGVGASSGGDAVCEYTTSNCDRECPGDCTPSGCKKNSSEKQTYKCNSNIPSTQPAGGDNTSGTVSSNGVPNPKAACCFVSSKQSANRCSNGADYIRVYAHASERVNNDMSTPCTSDAPPNGYGNAYGASKWFYCDDSTVDGCENKAGYDLTLNNITPPFGCTTVPSTGCGIYRGSNSTRQIINGKDWCCPDPKLVTPTVNLTPTGAGGAGTPPASTTDTPTPPVPGVCILDNCPAPNTSVPYYYKVTGLQTNYYKTSGCPDTDSYTRNEIINNYCDSFVRTMKATVNIDIKPADITDARPDSPYTIQITTNDSVGFFGTSLLIEQPYNVNNPNQVITFPSKKYNSYTASFCYEEKTLRCLGEDPTCLYEQNCIQSAAVPYSSDNTLNFTIVPKKP